MPDLFLVAEDGKKMVVTLKDANRAVVLAMLTSEFDVSRAWLRSMKRSIEHHLRYDSGDIVISATAEMQDVMGHHIDAAEENSVVCLFCSASGSDQGDQLIDRLTHMKIDSLAE